MRRAFRFGVAVLTTCAAMLAQPTTAATAKISITAGQCSSSCVLRVTTNQRVYGYVEYGYSKTSLSLHTSVAVIPASGTTAITVSGLRTGVTVFYRLRFAAKSTGPFSAGSVKSVRTQPVSTGDALVVAIEADPHMDENSDAAVFSSTIAQINASKASFLIDLGDIFMIDKLQQKTDANIRARYVLMKGFYDKLDPSIPLYFAMGNHDGEAGWEPLQGHTYRAEYFPKQTQELNYYAIEQGNALFVVLDPFTYTKTKPGTDGWKWTLGKTQYDWLQHTLSTSSATHKYVCIHHLVGGSDQGRGGAEVAGLYEWGGKSPGGADDFAKQRPGWAMPIHSLLKKYGVEIVFKGHDHFYGKQVFDGIVYQTLPQPSHPGDKLGSVAAYGYLNGDFVGGSGYLKLSISSASTLVEFINSTGAVRTSYTTTS